MRRSDRPSFPNAMIRCFFPNTQDHSFDEAYTSRYRMSWISSLVGRFSADPHWPVLGRSAEVRKEPNQVLAAQPDMERAQELA